MEEDTFDPDMICRACAKSHNGLKIDFSPNVIKLYTWCSRTPFETTDPLPKQLCFSCYLRLTLFEQFQNQCVDSYHAFINRRPKYVISTQNDTFEITIKTEKDEEPVVIKNELLEDDGELHQIENDSRTAASTDTIATQIENNDINESEEIIKNEIVTEKLTEDIVLSRQLESPPYTCSKCQTISWEKEEHESNLASHENFAIGDQIVSSKPYACNKCPLKFYEKQSYEVHMNRHFKTQRAKENSSKINIKQHTCSIRVMKPVWFVCNVRGCSQKYKSPKVLKEHIASHYMKKPPQKRNNSPITCKMCGLQFICRKTFKTHCDMHNNQLQIIL